MAGVQFNACSFFVIDVFLDNCYVSLVKSDKNTHDCMFSKFTFNIIDLIKSLLLNLQMFCFKYALIVNTQEAERAPSRFGNLELPFTCLPTFKKKRSMF